MFDAAGWRRLPPSIDAGLTNATCVYLLSIHSRQGTVAVQAAKALSKEEGT